MDSFKRKNIFGVRYTLSLRRKLGLRKQRGKEKKTRKAIGVVKITAWCFLQLYSESPVAGGS